MNFHVLWLKTKKRSLDKERAAKTLKSPVVQICGVDHLGPELFQQGPDRATRQRFGQPGREGEPDGPSVGDAHVAVGPIGHVLHQPLNIDHGEVVDVESSPWKQSVIDVLQYKELE